MRSSSILTHKVSDDAVKQVLLRHMSSASVAMMRVLEGCIHSQVQPTIFMRKIVQISTHQM
jgi:hypothetical protein